MHNEKFLEKLDLIDENNKKISFNYFTKQEAITELYEIVMAKFKLNGCGHFGNYNAKVMFIVDFKNTNDKAIEIIKKFYEDNNANFYSLYITGINKFNNEKINIQVLNKEISIIKPSRIVILGSNIKLNLDEKSYLSITYDELNTIIDCIDDGENIKKYSNFSEVRKNVINAFKFAIYG